MQTRDLNHIALHVADLETSMDFYGTKLGLEAIPRPEFSFPGAWYRIGVCQQLHLIGGFQGEVSAGSRGNHFAIGVDSIGDTERFLATSGLEPTPRKTRPDGASHLFVEDPDGYVIEFCQF